MSTQDELLTLVIKGASTAMLMSEINRRLSGANGNGQPEKRMTRRKKRQHIDHEGDELIKSLVAKGWSAARIAKKMNCSYNTIWRRLK